MTDVKIYDEMHKLVDEVTWNEYILATREYENSAKLLAECDQQRSRIERYVGYIKELREIKVSPNERTTVNTKTVRDLKLIEFADARNVEPPPPVQANLPSDGRIC